jgi:hypothetical protein
MIKHIPTVLNVMFTTSIVGISIYEIILIHKDLGFDKYWCTDIISLIFVNIVINFMCSIILISLNILYYSEIENKTKIIFFFGLLNSFLMCILSTFIFFVGNNINDDCKNNYKKNNNNIWKSLKIEMFMFYVKVSALSLCILFVAWYSFFNKINPRPKLVKISCDQSIDNI